MCMTKQTEDKSVKRDYKSRMFTMIFSDKKELLQLYNAVAQRNYDNPELLTINTLENAIYMSMHYNGKEERPEKEVIKLSDSYMTQGEEVSLELLVDV